MITVNTLTTLFRSVINYQGRSALVLLLVPFLVFCQAARACPDIDGLVDINCDQRLQIVCFGDSITFGRADAEGLGYPGRLARLLPNAVIINLGVPGEDTFRGRDRASRQLSQFPGTDYVVVLEGVNDFFVPVHSAPSTRNNVLAIVQRAKNIGAITLLANLTEIRRENQKPWVRAVNQQINPHRQIDFFSLGAAIISNDLIHPDGPGYEVMAGLVRSMLIVRSEANRPVDTDADGIYDFAEARFGTNPLIADTDGDQLLDGAEVFIHGSSPLLVDTDGDGFSDTREVLEIGSDPANALPGAPTLQTLEVIRPIEG